MTERDRHQIALLDTSVVIDLDQLDESQLPVKSAIAAVTLAELSGGLHTTNSPIERAIRLTRLQVIEASFDPLAFDAAAARHYGHLVARVITTGQNPRPRRFDLMIAATAHAHDLPLYTRNSRDLSALTSTLTIVAV